MVKMLRSLRKGRGMTMKELGKLIGVSESAISQYETDKREPDYSTLQVLSDYFGVSTDYLLGRTDEKEKPTPVSEGGPVDQMTARLNELLEQANPATKKAMIDLLEQLQPKE